MAQFSVINPNDGAVVISDQFSGLFYVGEATLSDSYSKCAGNFTHTSFLSGLLSLNKTAYDSAPSVGSCTFKYTISFSNNSAVLIEPLVNNKLYAILTVKINGGITEIVVLQSGTVPNPPRIHVYSNCTLAPYWTSTTGSQGLRITNTSNVVTFDSRKNPLIVSDVVNTSIASNPTSSGGSYAVSISNDSYPFNGAMYPNSYNFIPSAPDNHICSLPERVLLLGYSHGTASRYSQYYVSGGYGGTVSSSYLIQFQKEYCTYQYVSNCGYESVQKCEYVMNSSGYYEYQCRYVYEYVCHNDFVNVCTMVNDYCNQTISIDWYVYGSSTSRYSTFYREGVGKSSNGVLRGWIQYAELKSFSNDYNSWTSAPYEWNNCSGLPPNNTLNYQPNTNYLAFNPVMVTSGLNVPPPRLDSTWERFPYSDGTVNIETNTVIVAKAPV